MKDAENISPLHKAILTEAQQDVDEILANAQDRAKNIRQKAESRARAAASRLINNAKTEAMTLQERSAARAQLDAQMLKLQRREDLIQQVFEQARTQLSSIAQKPDWALVVHTLLNQAIEELDSQSDPEGFIVHADPLTQDTFGESFLLDVSQQLHVKLSFGSPLVGKTGVLVVTHDGHRQYDNTLETRYERMMDELRFGVYGILTGKQS